MNRQVGMLIALCWFSVQTTHACAHNHLEYFDCDLCGCSTSSGSAGFGTLDNLSFVGLRYMYQHFESRDGIYSNSPTSKEMFHTYQLWGRVPISKSFYVNAIVPYQDLTRRFHDHNEHLTGLGDISVIGWYQWQFKKKGDSEDINFNPDSMLSPHRLNIGLGVKLPTGEFEQALTDRVNPGFQLGTGSVDVMLSLMHVYSKNSFGLNTSATYYIKTENKNNYRFGNQFSVASNAFYKLSFNKVAWSPFVGMSMDVYDAIEQYGETLRDTSGHVVHGTLGSELMMNKFILGGNYSLPIAQDLFGGNVEDQGRLSIYLNYVL